MFGATVFNFWRTHDNWPMMGGPECQLAFILAYARKQREEYCSIFINNDHSEPDENDLPLRFAKMIKRRKKIDAITTIAPRPKRPKKNCPFDIELRRVQDGAESVQLICPGNNMECKVVALLEAVSFHGQVSSLELQVCARCPQADACVFGREIPLGQCLGPLTPL